MQHVYTNEKSIFWQQQVTIVYLYNIQKKKSLVQDKKKLVQIAHVYRYLNHIMYVFYPLTITQYYFNIS